MFTNHKASLPVLSMLTPFSRLLALGIGSAAFGQVTLIEDRPTSDPAKSFTYSATTTPVQIPLCMIGDCITWAQEGDVWRKVLLEHLPRLAFIGTHSAKLGYSHAGEGGNSVLNVLDRLDAIPDCPYYSVHIGTNSNSTSNASQVPFRAAKTAKQINDLVTGLLKKKRVKKVFLCSILPCDTENPLRDKTNSATNVLLRDRLGSTLPRDKVAWVELEKPVRATENWRPDIRLHPTPAGYCLIGKILAEHISRELSVRDTATIPVQKPHTGVRVHNLWNEENDCTYAPVIAGWYVVSFDLKYDLGMKPSLTIRSSHLQADTPYDKNFDLATEKEGARVAVRFFTGYEGYGYTRDHLTILPQDCEIHRILFEKRRPSGQPSRYGKGSYVDTTNVPSLGELIEAE